MNQLTNLCIAICLVITMNTMLTGQTNEAFRFNDISVLKANDKSATVSFAIPLRGYNTRFNATPIPTKDKTPNKVQYHVVDNDNHISGYMTMIGDKVVGALYDHGTLITYSPTKQKDIYTLTYGSSHDFECGVKHTVAAALPTRDNTILENGSVSRVYKLAVAVTGEYYLANGNNDTDVAMWLNFAVNGISAIFKNEMNISFDMLTPNLTQTNPNTDFFIEDEAGGDSRTIQAAEFITDNFNVNTYDIGHVFHNHDAAVNGGFSDWSSGGVAFRGVVCRSEGVNGTSFSAKAGGWSGSFNNQRVEFIALTAHEFGHMFGAQHTFNGIGESCTDAISDNNAYEIGSGTTLMSYNGICESDNNIPNSGTDDDYFHIASLVEMHDYLESVEDCSDSENTGNTPPVSIASACNESITIPKSTPFILYGNGSDADGDAITYCWEQFDEDGAGTPTQGNIGTVAAGKTNTPLFRSYPPSYDPVRYFPDKQTVLDGIINPFDVLPTVARTITMRLTVRDNNPLGGAVGADQRIINVDQSGPLQLAEISSITAGVNTEITWDTNGSDDLCDNVEILLSIDGGLNFDIVLAQNVDYASGSRAVAIPAGLPQTDLARVMLICENSACSAAFYDVTENFSCISECLTIPNTICVTDSVVTESGNPGLVLDTDRLIGLETNMASFSIDQSDTPSNVVRRNLSNNCELVPINFQLPTDGFEFSVTETGNYAFTFEYDETSRYIAIFEADSYDPENPCTSFVTSNSTASMDNPDSGSTSYSTYMGAELEKCKKYKLEAFTYSNQSSVSVNLNVISSGSMVIDNNQNTDYSYTFIAVNTVNNTIIAQSDLADFTGLPGGLFHVYGVHYDSVEDASAWVGNSINDLYDDGICILPSSNFRPVLIEGGCTISNVELGNIPVCTDTTVFDLDVTITSSDLPESNEIEINGTIYTIEESTQTFTLTDLPADGTTNTLTITVPDDEECNIVDSTPSYVSPSINPVIDTVIITNPTGCFSEDGVIEIRTINNGNFTYIVSPPGTTSFNNATGLFENLPPNLYNISVQNGENCSTDYVNNPINLEGVNDLVIELDTVTTFCIDAIMPISVSANKPVESYEWTDILDPVTILETTDMFTPTTSGDYRVIVTDETGCSKTEVFQVSIFEIPTTNITPDTIICEGDLVAVSVDNNVANPPTFEWQFNGTIIDDSVSNTFSVSEAGQYTVRIINDAGCESRDTFNLETKAQPTFELGIDVTSCGDQTVVLKPIEPVIYENVSYQWFNTSTVGILTGETRDSLVVTQTDNGISSLYVLEATNGDNECMFTDTIRVNYFDEPILTIDSTEIRFCAGSSTLVQPNTNFDQLNWFFNGIPVIDTNAPELLVSAPGTLEVIGGEGVCTAKDTVEIIELELPTLELGNDKSGCPGETFVLDAQNNNATFDWYLGDELIANDISDQITVNQSGVYTAEAQNTDGCINTDSLTVVLLDNYPIALGEDREVCDNVSFAITSETDAPNISWHYSPTGDAGSFGGAISVGDSLQCLPGQSGYYYAETQRIDCYARDTIQITKLASPQIDLPDVMSQCNEMEEVILTTTLENDATYTWFKDGEGMLSETSNTLTVTESGNYVLSVTNTNECSNTKEVLVQPINTNYELNFTSNNTLLEPANDTIKPCINNSLTINVVAEDPFAVAFYDWYTNINGTPINSGNNFVINDNQSRKYYVISRYANNNCEEIDSFVVSYLQPEFIEIDDVSICANDSITINTGLNSSYTHLWYRNGSPINHDSTGTITLSIDGEYSVAAYVDDPTCFSEETFTLTRLDAPGTLPLDDDVVCSNEPYTFEVVAEADNYSYEWFDNEGQPIVGAQQNTYSTTDAGNYSVVISTTNGCTDTLSATLTESFIDPLELGENISLCPGDEVTLMPTGNFAEYEWSTSETTSSITLTPKDVVEITSEVITLTVNNGEECSITDEITVTTFPPITSILDSDKMIICAGDSVRLSAIGGLNYEWNNANTLDDNTSNGPTATPIQSTTYVVTISDNCPNNTVIDSLKVDVYPVSNFSAGMDTCAVANVPFILNATGGTSYDWIVDDNITSGENTANPTILINEDATFVVNITDENGCMYQDSVNVCIKGDAESLVKPMTIMTPNGDNMNDYLYFEGLEAFPDNTLTIFNKWGNIVFSAYNYQQNGFDTSQLWDGRNGSQQLPPDTYFYILEFNGIQLKNTITITLDK